MHVRTLITRCFLDPCDLSSRAHQYKIYNYNNSLGSKVAIHILYKLYIILLC